ncbi:MAG: hypothetical protein M1840_005076 [Geoglossum simile]|nr:MAG: hypothetical protein M1840_005076 [Geoglossum simile]
MAQQPLEARHYYNAPSLEQEMDEWLTWLKPVLEYVNQYVSSGYIVEVDDDDREETSELVKECLPNGCRKVQTRTGGLCFMRGEFSPESGIITPTLRILGGRVGIRIRQNAIHWLPGQGYLCRANCLSSSIPRAISVRGRHVFSYLRVMKEICGGSPELTASGVLCEC